MYFIKSINKDEILKLNEDSLILHLNVNWEGKIDYVCQVSPKNNSFNSTKRFIKDYDFKGHLVEFYTQKAKPIKCKLQLVIVLLEQKFVEISVQLLQIKEEY